MKTIPAREIAEAVKLLFISAAVDIGQDVLNAVKSAAQNEKSTPARECLNILIQNDELAKEKGLPICQDTGMAVVFMDIGQDVHIKGGLRDAVNEGVKAAYAEGYLRKSVLSPLSRVNTGDNTPCVLHTQIVPGEKITIHVMPKGFGSENMSRLFMLTPAQGRDGVLEAITSAVDCAGANACPPVIVGAGIGGTSEYAMYMAKRALLRETGAPSTDADTAALEKEALSRINALGIGAMGLGGTVTALAVHIETYPTHIAGLPVAVNLQCHVSRHKKAVL